MDEYSPRAQQLIPLLAGFCTAAQEGHITRAAQRLGVPQSSLSRRLRTIESIMGVDLFQPVGRGVGLTVAGRELFERTKDLVRELDRTIELVRGDADPDHGLVRFGFPLSLGPVSIPALLADFSAQAPGIRLSLTQAHGEALAGLIQEGRLDLAVMIPAPADMPTTEVGRQRIYLTVARNHRLAGRDEVQLAELADEVFIANPRTYHLRQLLDSWCAAEGFAPRVALEITEFDTLRAFVSRGLGVALLPLAETPQPGLVNIALAGEHDRSIGLVSAAHRLTPAVQRLHTHIATHAMSYLGGAQPRHRRGGET